MDPLKTLTRGVVLGKGNKSKSIRFADVKQVEVSDIQITGDIEEQLDFFKDNVPKLIQPSRKRKREEPFPSNGSSRDEEEDSSEQFSELQGPRGFETEEEVNIFRKKHRIHAHCSSAGKGEGTAHVPHPIRSFADLVEFHGVDQWIVSNILENFKYSNPTSVQKQAITCILSKEPLLASAPTGSGKTLAFLIPILSLLRSPSPLFGRALVLCPSRELAVQTVREFDLLKGLKKFKSRLLDKLVGEGQNIQSLDLAVSTPLCLVQLLRDGKVCLKDTQHVVLDEADRLMDMGFASQSDEILSHCTHQDLQILLFSATLPVDVIHLAESIMHDPIKLSIGAPMAASVEVSQRLMFVTKSTGKLSTFRQLLGEGEIVPPTLIFVQSIAKAKELFSELAFDKICVDTIHSEKTKKERDETVQAFREKKVWILICTDLMSRGVDFKGVQVVINWDFPPNAASYIHRVGRTGRAGRKGKAITFFTLEDLPRLHKIVGVMRQSGCTVPEWMLGLKKKVHMFSLKKRIKTKTPTSKKH